VTTRIITGDCRAALMGLASESVDCCVTSPPYFGLRDYRVAGQVGLEPSPDAYVAGLVAVFGEVRRVLRKDGTLWLNISDAYANKQLLGIPWKFAETLRESGWILRSEITWAKRAPMPESVTDRPTSATEKVFLLTKSPRYFYDAEAVKEEAEYGGEQLGIVRGQKRRAYAMGLEPTGNQRPGADATINGKRNMRNWWLLGPEPFPEAHFAVFPSEIPRRAILAGTSARGVCPKCGAPWERMIARRSSYDGKRASQTVYTGSAYDHPQSAPRGPKSDFGECEAQTIGWRQVCSCEAGDPVPATVLDCFFGAGTTALVADQLRRNCIGIELNAAYAEMAERRVREDCPLFVEIAAE
jgi:DNA modification methylase